MKDDQMSIPHLFRCPISLDLFADPVTLCTGQTYDRSSIEKWLSAGNLTCPVTMQKLHDLTLVPNHTLQHLIAQWLTTDNCFNSQHLNQIDPDLSLAALKHNLQSQESTFTLRLESLRRIRILSEETEYRSSWLIQFGFFQLLLQLLFGNLSHAEANLSEEDSQLSEQALDCVLKLLPFSKLDSLHMLKEASNLTAFVVLLDQGSVKIKMNLCYLVEAIASSLETKDLCLMLGKTQGLLRGLIALLHENSEASEAGSIALSSLCSLELNRESVVSEGGIDGLVTYLMSANKHQALRALATLELLLEIESAKQAMINNPNGVDVLVKMVFRVSDHEGSESAVSSLLIICYESLSTREKAICAGVLTQLLLLLQSQCSCRAKNKARVLLKLLRSMWVEDQRKCSSQYGLVDA